MRLEVCWLCELLGTTVERTDIWPVTYANKQSQYKTRRQTKTDPYVYERASEDWNPTKTFCHSLRKCTKMIDQVRRGKHWPIITWKGFSPVWTNWCLFNLLDSTKALPHSAQTCTRGPWVWRCFRIALLSRNILEQPSRHSWLDFGSKSFQQYLCEDRLSFAIHLRETAFLVSF